MSEKKKKKNNQSKNIVGNLNNSQNTLNDNTIQNLNSQMLCSTISTVKTYSNKYGESYIIQTIYNEASAQHQ